MKSKRNNLLSVLFAFLFASFPLFSINQTYGTYSVKVTDSKTTTLSRAVCYFTDSKRQYYSTIEAGLAAAKSLDKAITVYVIPGDTKNKVSVTIKSDCTIGSKVTLTLPYSGEKYVSEVANDVSRKDFADADPNTYQTLQVILNPSVKLTIESGGKLNIGGVRGNDASPNSQGQTTGEYAELIMKHGSHIECSGSIDCNGYIREDYVGATVTVGTTTTTFANNDNVSGEYERVGNGSYINVTSTGSVSEPLVFYDWRGGSASASIFQNGNQLKWFKWTLKDLSKRVFPLNLFDLPQIAPKLRFYAGAKLIGKMNINYADSIISSDNKTNHFSEETIVGTTNNAGFINASDTSRTNDVLVLKSSDTTRGTQIKDFRSINYIDHFLDIGINGKYNFGSISVTMKLPFLGEITINSKDYFMPMSNIFHLVLHNGSVFNLNNYAQFLPGSEVTIESGATANINKDLIFHSSSTYSGPKNGYASKPGDAKFTNNGTLNIKANYGGKILASSKGNSNSTINISTNLSQITVSEITNEGTGISQVSYSATADIASSATSRITDNLQLAKKTYKWMTNGGKYGWYPTT